ncbi:MAG: amino acid ABC transporter permease [Desulfurococcales archaeon]|nr:amino acid ABC transporter permease [Desulfurococcales archaeon]
MLDLALTYADLLLEGLGRTIAIAILGFALGFTISMLLSFMRFLAPWPVKSLAEAYIGFFRGTPLLVQIFMIFFGLPSIGIKMNAFTAATLAIGLNSGAYQAEIVRSTVKGVPEEQLLVARSLGLSEAQILRHVVLPQAVRNAIPALTNEYVMLLKESALASVIGVMELTRVGEFMTAATFRALEAYLLVALIYLAVSYTFMKASKSTEKKLAIPGYERWVK